MALLLRLSGHQVHVCYSGEQALEAIQGFTPEVVLLDIGMPELDGHQTCRLIRQQPGGQTMVVIALTGYFQEEIKYQTEPTCFDGHLVKPADVASLNALLETLLPQ